MTSIEETFVQLHQAIRAVVEAFKRFAQVIADAFVFVFDKAKARAQEITEFLEQLRIAAPPKRISPHLVAPLTSWAYYSKRPFHQPKHGYRQERIWRHQG